VHPPSKEPAASKSKLDRIATSSFPLRWSASKLALLEAPS